MVIIISNLTQLAGVVLNAELELLGLVFQGRGVYLASHLCPQKLSSSFLLNRQIVGSGNLGRLRFNRMYNAISKTRAISKIISSTRSIISII